MNCSFTVYFEHSLPASFCNPLEKKLRDVCLKHRLLCWEFDFGSIIILSACGMNETLFFSLNLEKFTWLFICGRNWLFCGTNWLFCGTIWLLIGTIWLGTIWPWNKMTGYPICPHALTICSNALTDCSCDLTHCSYDLMVSSKQLTVSPSKVWLWQSL